MSLHLYKTFHFQALLDFWKSLAIIWILCFLAFEFPLLLIFAATVFRLMSGFLGGLGYFLEFISEI